MKQTAVDWLQKKLIESGISFLSEEIEYINQAKEMEKEQMCDTWVDSRTFDKGDNYFGKQKSFDEYYNVIFNTKEK
jgi:hypothetical protein